MAKNKASIPVPVLIVIALAVVAGVVGMFAMKAINDPATHISASTGTESSDPIAVEKAERLKKLSEQADVHAVKMPGLPENYKIEATVEDFTLAVDPETGEMMVYDGIAGVGINTTSVEGQMLVKEMMDMAKEADGGEHSKDTKKWMRKVAHKGLDYLKHKPTPLAQDKYDQFEDTAYNPPPDFLKSPDYPEYEDKLDDYFGGEDPLFGGDPDPEMGELADSQSDGSYLPPPPPELLLPPSGDDFDGPFDRPSGPLASKPDSKKPDFSGSKPTAGGGGGSPQGYGESTFNEYLCKTVGTSCYEEATTPPPNTPLPDVPPPLSTEFWDNHIPSTFISPTAGANDFNTFETTNNTFVNYITYNTTPGSLAIDVIPIPGDKILVFNTLPGTPSELAVLESTLVTEGTSHGINFTWSQGSLNGPAGEHLSFMGDSTDPNHWHPFIIKDPPADATPPPIP